MNSYDPDFDKDDIMNEPVPFEPPYVYQRKHHIGLISVFDVGFQQAALKTDRETASQNYVRDLTQYNRCPMALINENFF